MMGAKCRAGGTQLLPRIVGRTKAKELIFTGRRVNSDEAAHMGERQLQKVFRCLAQALRSVEAALSSPIAAPGRRSRFQA